MLKKLLGKVMHSLEHSKSGGHRRYSSSHKGRPVYSRHSSSSSRKYKGHSSSDARRRSGGHKYYKNRYGSSS
ncbi:hypothetical protein [Paenibacillus sp. MMS20-IR301]|uniref:hypothetical protein n=1 Tax=Paenibacillus sp. MMS20-IR301 TaxID=2895946 RepID=UPI0028E2E874|nr:hypothetical protein [Paenibacillus sp. MMS20-IR301]WNS44033.1 hypothetical protein LOS79_01840 [Paenibacillus sp. MMS20-IR301]